MSCNCGNCKKSCPTIASGDCRNLKKSVGMMIDDHIVAAGGLDECSPSFCKDVLNWAVNQAKNTSCILRNLVNQICSLWSLMNMLVVNGYMPVTKNYTYTVPKEKFVENFGGNVMYWSGSPDVGECYIDIPIAEMDIVDTVVAQPQVVGQKVHAVTVAIQTSVRVGDVYRVNFDTYEIQGNPDPGNDIPFSVPIKFVVFGRKKISNNGHIDSLC